MWTTTLAPFRERPRFGGLARMIRGMSGASRAAGCAREAERLYGLSDADLAREGLTRDRILAHAFRPFCHL